MYQFTKPSADAVRTICSVLFLLLLSQLKGQTCGTSVDQGLPFDVIQRASTYSAWQNQRSNGITYVKLKVFIASTVGPGGDAATLAEFQRGLDIVNTDFLPGNIQFILCGEPNIVDDGFFYAVQNPIPIEDSLNEYGYINVFIPSYIFGPGGFQFFDHVFVMAPYLNTHILSHELGHALGLYHTHDTPFGAELVNGTNCSTAGDLICDTPADPNMSLPGMYDYNTCSYIGTAVDSNGQSYSPDATNIMSYAPSNCTNHFTPSQFNVMHYTIDSLRSYLKSTLSPVVIAPFPTRLCTYSGDISLTANIPGTFSGFHVTGNVLGGFDTASGSYAVHYTPSVAPDSISTHIDQYYIEPSYGGFPFANILYGNLDTVTTFWQSFTAAESGTMPRIEMYLRPLSLGTIQYKIYSGSGIAGTVLFTGSRTVSNTSTLSWINFPISTTVNVTAGSAYTIEVIPTSINLETVISASNTWGYWYSSYSDGVSTIIDRDFMFREYVRTLPGCQEAHRYYEVYTPPDGQLLNLSSEYCISDDSVILKGDIGTYVYTIYLDTSYVTIDGAQDSLLVPPILSLGSHVIQYINSYLGCIDTTTYSINVSNGSSAFVNFQDTVCINTNPYMLQAIPSGGDFYVDSILSSSLFDPSQVGPGWHDVTYVNTSVRDTIEWFDQRCCDWTPGLGYTFLNPIPDSVYWQSFNPTSSGQLERIGLYYYITDTLYMETWLYYGEGTVGSILLHDTILVPANSNLTNDIFLSYTNIFVNKDSMYSIAFKRIPNSTTPSFSGMILWNGSPYPNGLSNGDSVLTATDFSFDETISQINGCISTVTDSVFVDVCTSILSSEITNDWQVYPSPASEHFTISNASNTLPFSAELFDISGKRVLVASGTSQIQMNVSEINAGLYTLQISQEGALARYQLTILHN